MFLEGKNLADKIFSKLAESPAPRGALCVIFIGDDKTSALYIAKKKEAAEKLKVEFKLLALPAKTSQDELVREIEKLNSSSRVSGILVQMPLPNKIDRFEVAAKITPEKDVDGFNYIANGSGRTVPPTVLAIDELLDFYKIKKLAKKILIVGRGFLVGRPLETFWQFKGYDIEVMDRESQNYSKKLKESEIVVVATGGGRKFSFNDFSPNSVIIDASTVAEEGALWGDVSLVGWPGNIRLAPTPGGVGPVTVAMLYRNFYSLK